MNNIFENVKFGDKFLTRDGRVAVFSHLFLSKDDNEIFAELMIPQKYMTEYNMDSINKLMVSLDGTWHRKKYESDNDIVSKYKEFDNIEELIRKLEYCEPIVKRYNNEKIKENITIINKVIKLLS